MSAERKRLSEIEAKIVKIVGEVTNIPAKHTLIVGPSADVRDFAVLTLTFSAALLLYGLQSPAFIAPSIVGIILGAALFGVDKFSLSTWVKRVERALDTILPNNQN